MIIAQRKSTAITEKGVNFDTNPQSPIQLTLHIDSHMT